MATVVDNPHVPGTVPLVKMMQMQQPPPPQPKQPEQPKPPQQETKARCAPGLCASCFRIVEGPELSLGQVLRFDVSHVGLGARA
eukprot:3169757-Alexandrium_andersonii.AAC.1